MPEGSFEAALLRYWCSGYEVLLLGIVIAMIPAYLMPYVAGVEKGPGHEVLLIIGGVALAVFLGLRWFKPIADDDMLKLRSKRGAFALLVVRLLLTASLIRYWHTSYGILVKLFTMFMLPLSSAKDNVLSQSFVSYIVANTCLTWYQLQNDFWEDGWQWMCISFGFQSLLLYMTNMSHHYKDALVTLESTCGILQKVMSILCDGYILLDKDGRIAHTDKKAACHLELGQDDNPQLGMEFASFLEPFGPREEPTMRGMWEGLRSLRLRTSSGRRYQVEAYAIPWSATQKGVTHVLGGTPSTQEHSGGSYLCGIRIIQELLFQGNREDPHASQICRPSSTEYPACDQGLRRFLGSISEEGAEVGKQELEETEQLDDEEGSSHASVSTLSRAPSKPGPISAVFDALSDGCLISSASPQWLALWSQEGSKNNSLLSWMGEDRFTLFARWLQPFVNRSLVRPWSPKAATSRCNFGIVFRHANGSIYNGTLMVTLLPPEHFHDEDEQLYEAIVSLQRLRRCSQQELCTMETSPSKAD